MNGFVVYYHCHSSLYCLQASSHLPTVEERAQDISLGWEGGGVLGGGSNPSPPARGSGQLFKAEPRPPKGFPLFSALRMASPDSVILFVDYHAALGEARPHCPFCFTSIFNLFQRSEEKRPQRDPGMTPYKVYQIQKTLINLDE